jgi:cell division transport system permease protein
MVSTTIKRKKKFSYAFSIISIAMVLLMMGLFGFLVLASQNMETYLKENMVVQVFFDADASMEEVAKVQQAIVVEPYLKSITYVSKEQAAKEFSNELGQDFVNFLGFNPLMASFQIKLNQEYNTPSGLLFIEQSLRNHAKVSEVSYHQNAYDLAQKNVQSIALIFVFLAAIFGIIAIVLIHNTVRLNLYAQRFIIKSMQLVGAKPWFITKPFVWQGIKNGFWGWVIAWVLLVNLNQFLPLIFPEWALFNRAEALGLLYVGLLILGLLISMSSSFFTTRKYLYKRLEDLY